MTVCSFFLQGRCRFGERCKNEHPGQATAGTGNRFGALSNPGFGGRTGAQSQTAQDYSLSTADIKNDLTPGQGRPEWVFSCYGPGRNAPKQLFEGPQREQSFEELRLRHYEAAATGNAEQAVQEAQMLYAEAVKQMETVLSDLDGAVKYVLQGANEHPNRIDIIEGRTGPSSGFTQPSPFGQQPQASATPAPAFGQPSAPGGGLGGGTPAFGKPSGFGQTSAFGQPSMPGQASGFGQPSALGQGSSGFGQPSALGQSSMPGQASGFGQPSALGQGSSGFGQPSALGQSSTLGQSAFGKPAFGQSSFGQPSFGQPSIGQPPAPGSGFASASGVSPFSQISNQNQQSGGGGFGQPSAPASNSPFAQVAQQQQQQAAPSGFGQPSAAPQGPTGFGQPSQAPSPFGQAQNTPAPFGQPSTVPNPFGAPAQQSSGFGQPSAAPQGPTGLGQPAAAAPAAPGPAPTQTATAGTGPPAIIKVDASTELNPIPPLNGQTVRDPMTKRLSMWKGQPVQYIDGVPCYLHPQDRQTPVRIFFPDGPPDQASLRDAQGKPEEYSPEVVEQYEFFVKNGYFKDGVIPSVPPKTEWVLWDIVKPLQDSWSD